LSCGVSLRPKIPNASSGVVLGLLGFYRGGALIAIEAFTGEIWISDAVLVIAVAEVVRQHRWDCRTG
jgi:hypothetical protein